MKITMSLYYVSIKENCSIQIIQTGLSSNIHKYRRAYFSHDCEKLLITRFLILAGVCSVFLDFHISLEGDHANGGSLLVRGGLQVLSRPAGRRRLLRGAGRRCPVRESHGEEGDPEE